VILSFRHEVDENCALLGCYNLSVPFSGVRNPKGDGTDVVPKRP